MEIRNQASAVEMAKISIFSKGRCKAALTLKILKKLDGYLHAVSKDALHFKAFKAKSLRL